MEYNLELHRSSIRRLHKLFLVENKIILQNDSYNWLAKYSLDNTFETIAPKYMRKITGNNFVSQVGILPYNNMINQGPHMVLDNLNDYGNIGSIIRSAYAFGFKSIIYISEEMDCWHHKTLEASRYLALELKPYIMTKKEFLEWCVAQNIFCILTTSGESPMEPFTSQLSQNMALIFGNETKGVQEDLVSMANAKYTIDSQFESLNVAVAAGIILHQYRRQ